MRILKYAALAAVIGLAACSTTGGGGGSGGTDIQPTVYSIGQKGVWLLNGVDSLGFPIPAKFCGPIKAIGTLYLATVTIAINGNGDMAAVLQNLQTALVAAVIAAAQAGFALAAQLPLMTMAPAPVDPTPAQWDAQRTAVNAGLAGLRCL